MFIPHDLWWFNLGFSSKTSHFNSYLIKSKTQSRSQFCMSHKNLHKIFKTPRIWVIPLSLASYLNHLYSYSLACENLTLYNLSFQSFSKLHFEENLLGLASSVGKCFKFISFTPFSFAWLISIVQHILIFILMMNFTHATHYILVLYFWRNIGFGRLGSFSSYYIDYLLILMTS